MSDRLDTVFDLLRSSRRRALVYFLNDAGAGTYPLEEVVEGVREYEALATAPDKRPARQEVRTSLVVAHLPRFAAVGALDHDPRTGTVQFYGYPPLNAWLERARHVERVIATDSDTAPSVSTTEQR